MIQKKEQKVTVVAKCPACKKKKTYVMPINYTPYCDRCVMVPMVIDKVKIDNNATHR